ncbi:MAG TPA: phosphopentomutase [Bacilli bacterium]|nr:phosphopentomutase [Bacilli bacterium]
MNKYKRMFVIVIDSVGIGEMPDAEKFGDKGANTLVHTAREAGGLKVPVMNSLGLGDLAPILGTTIVKHPHSYALRLRETSAGKDTMTGHWEMMGINTTKPFQTFTDTGFPQSLIDELAEKTGHKIIGNKAASGTEILVELGEQQMRENSLIVYTSADSVLQIAAHEEVTGVKELYRCCDIAREICMKPEYFVGRIIARPFIGTNKHNFKRTANRHDLAVSPTGTTTLDVLKNNGFMVSSIGKINDIFNTMGVVKAQKTVSNLDGMNKTIEEAKNHDFTGLCYVNLVEFDSEFGHRRNAIGYAKALEEFDVKLGELLKILKDDDLVMVTADHGNDPVHHGTDHTREKVPLLIYSKSIKNGRYLDERETFAVIGASVLENFGLKKTPNQIGAPIMEIFE